MSKTSRRKDVETGAAARPSAEAKAEEAGESPSAAAVIPDGGLHAWIIVVACFLTNGILFGICNCFGILYVYFKKELEQAGTKDATVIASLVGSLSIGTTFLVSPVAGIMIDSFGLRRTAMLGGIIATVGMLASSFACNNGIVLLLTYGVLFGIGCSLAYSPSLVILGHYFRKRLGLVNGLCTAGSSVFTILLPFFLDAVLPLLGLATTLQILAGMMALLVVCAVSYVPLLPPAPAASAADGSRCSLWKKYIDFSIWKNRRYTIWAIALPICMLGYFVPYVHVVAFVEEKIPGADGKILVQCIGITSLIGRLLFGKIGDFPRVNRVILQQTSFLAIGVSAMLLTLADTFAWLIVIALMLGLFDGCFIALVGPIAFDLCGPQSASQAIGFLLGLYAVPMTAGPTIAGILYEKWGSYRIPFLLSGCPPILCAIIMCFIRGGASAAATSALDDVAGVKRAPSKRKTSAMPVDGDVHHQQFQSKVYLSPDPAATKPSSAATCASGCGDSKKRLCSSAPTGRRSYEPTQTLQPPSLYEADADVKLTGFKEHSSYVL